MEQQSDLSPLILKDVIAIINNDDENSLSHSIKKLNQSGGIIYINTPIININKKSKLELSGINKGRIIGLNNLTMNIQLYILKIQEIKKKEKE